MSASSSFEHPLKRRGTSQSERFPAALSKDYVRIDERTFTDLIAQTAELSAYFNYYEHSAQLPEGNWQVFFNEVYDFSAKKSRIKSLEELTPLAATTPHLALLLAFIRLFSDSLTHLNSLGEKQLLFFYEVMLHLKKREGIAPKVTLFGEISKNSTSVFIPKSTRFKANKNTRGETIYFLSDEDVLLNNAVVTEIKNINFLNEKVTARSVSNSADGRGAAFKEDPKAWFPFGEKKDIATEVGFCLACPLFLINEGSRTVTLVLKNGDLSYFNAFMTTKVGWTPLQTLLKKTNIANDTAVFTLSSDFPEIISLDADLHKSNLDTTFPVLKLVLKDASSTAFELLKNIKPLFTVSISLKNIRNLTVQNENGKLDISKPFQPFGSNTVKGLSELIIGHPFLFNKFLTGNIVLSATGKDDKQLSTVSYLKNGTWEAAKPGTYRADFQENYDVTAKNNYIKYVYAGNYSREKYVSGFINTILNTTLPANVTIAKEDIPVWKDLSASCTLEFNQSNTEVFRFFHLHPFGAVFSENPDRLLPNYEKASFLLIGISGWKQRESLSIHFEMLEGSGNQDLSHPNIKWAVYSNNILTPLKNLNILRDNTLNLAQSGLIKFALDDAMYQKNTLLNSEAVWLVAYCSENYEAIPKFIDVSAQAFLATYEMPFPVLVEDILGEVISKPETPITGLKKILQPYHSFGGRQNEDQKSFITRSSEHLRHKGKAINIYDYERILLEKFPFLYLVKCISHSNAATEMAPGNVSVILIPNLKKDNTQHLLKPSVSLGDRVLIKTFLGKITSPFVSIEVRNPHYKEIRAEFNVRYHVEFAGDKDYYNSVLKERLKEYISPWLLNSGQISFNREGYVSSYINFIEELYFVDHITHFKVFVDGKEVKNKITAGKEDVIFTSAEDHDIKNDELC